MNLYNLNVCLAPYGLFGLSSSCLTKFIAFACGFECSVVLLFLHPSTTEGCTRGTQRLRRRLKLMLCWEDLSWFSFCCSVNTLCGAVADCEAHTACPYHRPSVSHARAVEQTACVCVASFNAIVSILLTLCPEPSRGSCE